MNTFVYYYYYLESKFVGYPFVIKVAMFLTLFLSFTYILSLLRMFLLVKRKNNTDQKKEYIKKQFEEKLRRVLYAEQDLSSKEIKEALAINLNELKDWEKRYISKLLIDLIQLKHESKHE